MHNCEHVMAIKVFPVSDKEINEKHILIAFQMNDVT